MSINVFKIAKHKGIRLFSLGQFENMVKDGLKFKPIVDDRTGVVHHIVASVAGEPGLEDIVEDAIAWHNLGKEPVNAVVYKANTYFPYKGGEAYFIYSAYLVTYT
jgi:hypothetical protein